RGFTRKEPTPINAALNYGYAIIRGSIARSLVSSGLLPTLGIFHRNQFNAFNLADDMMEPYRVFVDSLVCQMLDHQKLQDGFERSHRQCLVGILHAKILCRGKFYPMYRSIMRTIWSLANVLRGLGDGLALGVFEKGESDGREIYENFGDV
ncbi:type II CRISPR-associated endonuclease Cas1, partial [Helicobacter sp. 12S02634-8]|uniref:type II CRISPR-associated endonuclease Cas1 n=1 Tax=Helicobacter sp. 12S02634-8 TaxID=1476199 RepID=UPI000BC67CCE